jgi:hypothetical protein
MLGNVAFAIAGFPQRSQRLGPRPALRRQWPRFGLSDLRFHARATRTIPVSSVHVKLKFKFYI